jgi:hypothetical protein
MSKAKLYRVETSPGVGVLINISKPDMVDFRLLYSAISISDTYFDIDASLRIMLAFEALLHFMQCEDYERCSNLKLSLSVYWIKKGRY